MSECKVFNCGECAIGQGLQARLATVQGERERLFQVIELYRSASYQSHSAHFDPTGGSGSGCPACLRAIELRADARAILDSLAQPAAPSEVKE